MGGQRHYHLPIGFTISVIDSGRRQRIPWVGIRARRANWQSGLWATLSSALSSGDIHKRIDGYLNPSAFTPAPLLYPAQCDPVNNPNFCTTGFGNLGRNTFRGPGQAELGLLVDQEFQNSPSGRSCGSRPISSTSGITPTSPIQLSPTWKAAASARLPVRWGRRG